MSYLEFTGPPGCGKTTAARKLLLDSPALAPGRRSLIFSKASLHVDRFGLPPEGWRVWVRLALSLPRDLVYSARFLCDTGSFRLSRTMLWLLLKSRILVASSNCWVVDQGLQQLILSAVASHQLDCGRARAWRDICSSPPWGPVKLITITLNRDDLILRVKESDKHMRQCGQLTPENYVDKNIQAYELLHNG